MVFRSDRWRYYLDIRQAHVAQVYILGGFGNKYAECNSGRVECPCDVFHRLLKTEAQVEPRIMISTKRIVERGLKRRLRTAQLCLVQFDPLSAPSRLSSLTGAIFIWTPCSVCQK